MQWTKRNHCWSATRGWVTAAEAQPWQSTNCLTSNSNLQEQQDAAQTRRPPLSLFIFFLKWFAFQSEMLLLLTSEGLAHWQQVSNIVSCDHILIVLQLYRHAYDLENVMGSLESENKQLRQVFERKNGLGPAAAAGALGSPIKLSGSNTVTPVSRSSARIHIGMQVDHTSGDSLSAELPADGRWAKARA